jgi:hypothetical protein
MGITIYYLVRIDSVHNEYQTTLYKSKYLVDVVKFARKYIYEEEGNIDLSKRIFITPTHYYFIYNKNTTLAKL